MLKSLRSFYHLMTGTVDEDQVRVRLAEARRRTAVPILWLFGKTQSGKTSIIKYLTGADDAEIGNGCRPCTRTSRLYDFPDPEAPLLSFLDTRGLDEPGYEPAEEIAQFGEKAHLVVVTIKAMDHAQESVHRHLGAIRRASPTRPVVLALTCLHEAYPQKQHPAEYAFEHGLNSPAAPDALKRSIVEHQQLYAGLVDDIVPIDLTRPEEGFADPHYGGQALKESILRHLPEAQRQTLLGLDRVSGELRDAMLRQALPIILRHSYFAAGAGAVPVPFIDLLILPGVQIKMVMEIANLYNQPLTGKRFLELAGTLGMGMMARQAAREVMKLIPFVGAAAGAALAGASTFALGRAFCFYYREVREGHVPDPGALKVYFEKELAEAGRFWSKPRPGHTP